MSAEHPDYYTLPNGKQLLDYINRCSFPLGNVIKYVWRYRDKNGAEDLRKAIVYIDAIPMERFLAHSICQDDFRTLSNLCHLYPPQTANECFARVIDRLCHTYGKETMREVETSIAKVKAIIEEYIEKEKTK